MRDKFMFKMQLSFSIALRAEHFHEGHHDHYGDVEHMNFSEALLESTLNISFDASLLV